MASVTSTTVSSAPSLHTPTDTDPILNSFFTHELWNRGGPSQLTTAHAHSPNQESEILSLPTGVEDNFVQDRLSDALPLAVRHVATYRSLTIPQSAKPEDDPLAYRISNTLSQQTVSHDSNLLKRLQGRWQTSILIGCWSGARPDLHAACVVSYGPWTAESTPNLLANMFRVQYTRAFTDPWIVNTGTSRILNFLKVVGGRLEKDMGSLLSLQFRACVRRSALDAVHRSLDLVSSPSPSSKVTHS
jgi:hypothetical protein